MHREIAGPAIFTDICYIYARNPILCMLSMPIRCPRRPAALWAVVLVGLRMGLKVDKMMDVQDQGAGALVLGGDVVGSWIGMGMIVRLSLVSY